MARRKRNSFNEAAALTPMDYLLSVVGDESASMCDRIAAAQAVLPYLHLPLAPLDLDDDERMSAIQ